MFEPDFSLIQLRYFAETARAGSMTDAAKLLHVSQPALSSAINQLERDLGVQLFERIPRRGVRLTAAGHQFFVDAASLLALAEGMRERVGARDGVLQGVLRIGMYEPISAVRAPTLLRALANRYPEIQLELVEADHAGLRRMLAEQVIDVAIAYQLDPLDDFRAELLEVIPPHMIVPTEHPLAAARGPVSIARFAQDPLILLDLPNTADYYLRLYRGAGIEPEIRFRCRGIEAVRGLVATGFGVAPLNQRIAFRETYAGPKVVAVPLSGGLQGVRLMAVSRRDDESLRVQAFFEVCHRLFAMPQRGEAQ